jgi:hypothetical protein
VYTTCAVPVVAVIVGLAMKGRRSRNIRVSPIECNSGTKHKLLISSSYYDWAEKCNSYIRQQWHLEGYVWTNKCASIVACSCIFQLNHIISSKWAICRLCLYCIQWAMYGRFVERKHRMRRDRGILCTRLRKAIGSIVGRPFSVAEIQSQYFPNANYKRYSWANLNIRGVSGK